jgi:hypothetical protein
VETKRELKRKTVYICFTYWAVDFYNRKIKRLKEAKKATRRKRMGNKDKGL